MEKPNLATDAKMRIQDGSDENYWTCCQCIVDETSMIRSLLAVLAIASVASGATVYQVSQIQISGQAIIGSNAAINDSDQIVGAILPASAATGSNFHPLGEIKGGLYMK